MLMPVFLHIPGCSGGFRARDCYSAEDVAVGACETLEAYARRQDDLLPTSLLLDMSEDRQKSFDRFFASSAFYCSMVWIRKNEDESVEVLQISRDMQLRHESAWVTFHVCFEEKYDWPQAQLRQTTTMKNPP